MSVRAMRTPSQSHLSHVTRPCATEGCDRSCIKDGSRGLCSRCYTRRMTKEKAQKVKGTTDADRSCTSRDLDLVLPVRPKFEWLGNLKLSVQAMKAEDSNV